MWANAQRDEAAKLGERKTWMQSECCTWQNFLRGKNLRKCLYSVPAQESQTSCKVWLASVERRRCSNETKTRNLLKFAGVPQTN